MSLLGKADYETEKKMMEEMAAVTLPQPVYRAINTFRFVDLYDELRPVITCDGIFPIDNLPRVGELVHVEVPGKRVGDKTRQVVGTVTLISWDYVARETRVRCDWRVLPSLEKLIW